MPVSLSSSSSSLSGARSRRQHLNCQTHRGFFNLASAARSCRSVAVRPLRALPATGALETDPLEVRFNEVIESPVDRIDLSEEEAEVCLKLLLNEANEALISAFIVVLRAIGETFEEIVGLARAMIECAVKVNGIGDAVDIVGTGGDGANTVNISTGASIQLYLLQQPV